jgi:hypothetical protein
VVFAGFGRSRWPVVAAALSAEGLIDRPAHHGAQLLYDIVSFVSSDGRSYSIAYAQDMLQQGFLSFDGGTFTDTLNPTVLHAAATPGV